MPNRFGPGCCGCGPCANLGVTVRGCALAFVAGATVTVTKDGELVGTCTTGITGNCTVAVPSGTITVTITADGYCAYTQDVTISCPTGDSIAVQLRTNQFTATVTGCCSALLEGATVAITGGASGTTNSSGQVTVALACTGDVEITISKTRFISQTFNFTNAEMNTGQGCGVSTTLLPDTGYVCSPFCADPISETLTATDAVVGSFSLTYDGVVSGQQQFSAVVPYAFPGGGLCHCPAQDTTLTYTLIFGCTSGEGFGFTYTLHDPPIAPPCQGCPGSNTPSSLGTCGRSGFSVVCPPTFSLTYNMPTCAVYGDSLTSTVTITE